MNSERMTPGSAARAAAKQRLNAITENGMRIMGVSRGERRISQIGGIGEPSGVSRRVFAWQNPAAYAARLAHHFSVDGLLLGYCDTEAIPIGRLRQGAYRGRSRGWAVVVQIDNQILKNRL